MRTYRWKSRFLCGMLVVLVCPAPGCVSLQQFRALEARLSSQEDEAIENRRELEELKAQQQTVRTDQADIKADMIDLHTQMQEVSGKISSSDHEEARAVKSSEALGESMLLQLNQLQQEMQTAQSRIARVEKFFGLKYKPAPEPAKPPVDTSGPVPPPDPGAGPVPTPDPGSGVTSGTSGTQVAPDTGQEPFKPEQAYEAAYGLHKAGQYANARKAFEQFVWTYPDSPLVDNALFWIGETYYQSGDYENAILMYQKVMDKHPKGSKAPDSLLKMAYSLEKIGEPQAATAVLNRLVKEYPKASQVSLARKKIQQLNPGAKNVEKDRGQ
jgi:tol-pal system protein YbgF